MGIRHSNAEHEKLNKTSKKSTQSNHLRTPSDRNLGFALDLYKAITTMGGKGTNTFFSPMSITVALNMLNDGARNNTASELKKALYLEDIENEDVHSALQNILTSLKRSDDKTLPFTLNMANRIYVAKEYTIVDEYLVTLSKKYGTEAVPADFFDGCEKVRKEINNWVEETTNNKIKNLMPEGSFNSLTRAVLINAIYFKGLWLKKFNAQLTQNQEFFRKTKDSKKIKMMENTACFSFASVSKYECKILELPYIGEQLSMLLILPYHIDGLDELENCLTPETFRFMVDSMRDAKVNVKIPKFKLEIESSLIPVLNQLGVHDAFDSEKADLSGISNHEELYVSGALHKAFVDVNEKGTEAATATANRTIRFGPSPKVVIEHFWADHPFLFAIYDRVNQLVLFLGRLTDPK